MVSAHHPPEDRPRTPRVQVLDSAEMATELALEELRRVAEQGVQPLVSFATGGTFTLMLRRIAAEVKNRRLCILDFLATHLDEYVGFLPESPGGMIHELVTTCPPLGDMLRRGTFLPVPPDEDPAVIHEHGERLRRAGGVKLQYLGIGRNGHLAFNEPGTPLDSRFHVATLSESTRDDARPRFAGRPVPERAVTAGLADILESERLVLLAFGRGKAKAVRGMLEGDVTPACPASVVRRHPDALILLDRDAAAELEGSGLREMSADQERR